MKTSEPKLFLLAILVLMILGVSSASACVCGGSNIPRTLRERVNGAVALSASVFTGKVVAFEYRKGIRNEYMESQRAAGQTVEYETMVARFEVDRWWKRDLPAVTYMITQVTRNSDGTASHNSCDYNFKLGEKYLVYASGNNDELATHKCSRTATATQASADLEILGEGFRPIEPK